MVKYKNFDVSDILLVGGLAVGGYFLYKTLKPVADTTANVGNAISNAGNAATTTWTDATKPITDIEQGIANEFQGMLQGLNNAVNSIGTNTQNWLTGALGQLQNTVKNVGNGVGAVGIAGQSLGAAVAAVFVPTPNPTVNTTPSNTKTVQMSIDQVSQNVWNQIALNPYSTGGSSVSTPSGVVTQPSAKTITISPTTGYNFSNDLKSSNPAVVANAQAMIAKLSKG